MGSRRDTKGLPRTSDTADNGWIGLRQAIEATTVQRPSPQRSLFLRTSSALGGGGGLPLGA